MFLWGKKACGGHQHKRKEGGQRPISPLQSQWEPRGLVESKVIPVSWERVEVEKIKSLFTTDFKGFLCPLGKKKIKKRVAEKLLIC